MRLLGSLSIQFSSSSSSSSVSSRFPSIMISSSSHSPSSISFLESPSFSSLPLWHTGSLVYAPSFNGFPVSASLSSGFSTYFLLCVFSGLPMIQVLWCDPLLPISFCRRSLQPLSCQLLLPVGIVSPLVHHQSFPWLSRHQFLMCYPTLFYQCILLCCTFYP